MKKTQNKFNQLLFRWYQNNRRNFDWRKTKDPYKILVSEVMLQQTGTARVIPKYKEFLKKFPTAKLLARSSLGDVLRVWSGLGYNRRAKYLWGCARIVEKDYGRKFPKDFDDLMKLPGIGRSTAAALRSFSFGYDEPMIDTNIRRVLKRVFFPSTHSTVAQGGERSRTTSSGQVQKISSDKELFEFGKSLIPKRKGKDWNYAMLDVGALLCKAVAHDPACPFLKLHGELVEPFRYKKPQSKFAGSKRFYRGKILTLLGQDKKSQSSHQLQAKLGLKNVSFNGLLNDLDTEGLIKRHGGRVALPR